MQLDRQSVVDFIEREVGLEQAREAARRLPDQVDHDRDGGLLRQFGVDPHELVRRLGSVPGDGLSHSGGTGDVPGVGGTVTGTEDDYESGAEDGAARPRA
jgi:hypothetical protein